jgi:dynein heavy chain, axonemal
MMKIDGKSDNKPARFAKSIQSACLDFEPWIRVIRALKMDGLQQKHIDSMNAAIDKLNNSTDEGGLNTLKLKMDTSIANWENVQITGCTSKIEDISDTAFKEHSNITQLNQMKEDWAPLTWDLKEHKDTFILEGEAVENFTTLLDDHMIKTQTMKGSPYAVFMIEPITEWENKLERTIDFLDQWVSVQSTWRYLEPVFSSEDLMNQMRQHGTIFREVDREWKRLMKNTKADPSTESVWNIEGLNETLKGMRSKLEEVTKGLNQYLESKQGLFPRFYFLSNEELLEILSETKEPTKVQPHIGKCFEGINRLIFDEDKKIHGMKSMEGEEVKFIRVIDPVAARGNVEEWLLQVEEVMIKSVKQQTDMCLQDYAKREREKWVLVGWPGMAIIGVDMIEWTQGCEEAMKKNGVAGLEVYYDKLDKHMNGLVGLVRTNINALQRCTIEAMIVLDVHNKEVIKTEMIDKKEANVNAFAWTQQLRYYWDDNNVVVKNINNTCDYNYEYLGNSARLVITPLTDRCYRTLCSAVALNYGGAPEGPAGTGKTETVKDLAKALARQCIVFNCSDQMDHL